MGRIGVNPEKKNVKSLIYKQHRIIMPVYIPNIQEEYFQNSLGVFKLCLDSLFHTIDRKVTNITIINNASCKECHNMIAEYRELGYIDRYVVCQENRGKVEPCLNEVRASNEDFITIVDADVLFYEGWEQAVFDIFNNIPNAGVVSPLPMPNLAFYCNSSVFMREMFTERLKFGSIVDKIEMLSFAESVGNDLSMYNTSLRHKSWVNKQYILKYDDVSACVGAGHFFATYKRCVIDKREAVKVNICFAKGLEREYFDMPVDMAGLYRLSTIKSYAYHMGNSLPVKVNSVETKHVDKTVYIEKMKFLKLSLIPYEIRKIVFFFLRKYVYA